MLGKIENGSSSFFWQNSPQWARPSSFMRFLDHAHRRTMVGRTPLDEWWARRRDLYLTIHNNHKKQTSMPPVGFAPAIPANKRPQTYALDHAAAGTGKMVTYSKTQSCPSAFHEGMWWEWRNIAPLSLLDGGEWLAPHHGQFTAWGKSLQYALYRRLGRPQCQSHCFGEEIKCLSPIQIELWVHPSHNLVTAVLTVLCLLTYPPY